MSIKPREFKVSVTARRDVFGMFSDSWELRMSVLEDQTITGQTRMVMPDDISEDILGRVLDRMTHELLHAMRKKEKCNKCGQEIGGHK
jgi:hypothetical protein